MPRKDQTGPSGAGPRTGRGLGNCEPNSETNEQSANSNLRFGFGQGCQGRGKGRGFGRGRSRS